MSCFKRSIKVTSAVLAAAALFILLWYAAFRVLSSPHAVNSYQITANISDPFPSESSTIGIGGFNIAHGRGGKLGAENWQEGSEDQLLEHLDSIAAQISAANLDVVVLNEVDFSAAWSFNINQASYIAEQAGYSHVVEQRNMDIDFLFYEFKFGNAILSRYPVIESDLIKFRPSSIWENAFAGNHNGVISTLDTPFGQIGVIAIHLEYRSEEIRVEAARTVKELLNGYSIPIIAAGDFNSTPSGFPGTKKTASGENAIDYLIDESGFYAASNINSNEHLTFPSEQPKLVIDWILETGDLELNDGNAIQSNLSDHLMVTAKLTAPAAFKAPTADEPSN